MEYFVRHGQTDWNAEHKIMGSVDIPLNEAGENQAIEMREKLKDKKFDVIFTSPMKRAKKTAEIIGEPHKETPIVIADELREREILGLLKAESTTELFSTSGILKILKPSMRKRSNNWKPESFRFLIGSANNTETKIFYLLYMAGLARQFGAITKVAQKTAIFWNTPLELES